MLPAEIRAGEGVGAGQHLVRRDARRVHVRGRRSPLPPPLLPAPRRVRSSRTSGWRTRSTPPRTSRCRSPRGASRRSREARSPARIAVDDGPGARGRPRRRRAAFRVRRAARRWPSGTPAARGVRRRHGKTRARPARRRRASRRSGSPPGAVAVPEHGSCLRGTRAGGAPGARAQLPWRPAAGRSLAAAVGVTGRRRQEAPRVPPGARARRRSAPPEAAAGRGGAARAFRRARSRRRRSLPSGRRSPSPGSCRRPAGSAAIRTR